MDGLTVCLTRKDVRNISLRLSPDGCEVRVSAPWYVPRSTVESFVEQRRQWIAGHQEKQQQRFARRDQSRPNARARTQLRARVEQMLRYWEPKVGVKTKKLQIRDMHTRWGSCTPARGSIRISLMLHDYPDACLEYVLVHELTHFLEPSHNARFHRLVERVMPDWRQRKALLEAGKGL